ncbi:MAG: DMT family transporter, partial [Chlamydiae bacterium]|nr:DMT family transporter [Chlamydiota bacterium]
MKNQGIILGLLAACCFAIMNVIVKIKATTLDPALVTFARGAVGTLVFLPSAKKEVLHLVKKSGLLLWCRFLAGSFSIFAMFYNVQLSGAAAGTALAKTEAIFVIILSIVVCKTFPNHTEWGGIGLILFGVYVLYAPMIVHMECSFLLVGIAGAFVGGIALIALKKVSSLFSPFFIVWGLCLGSLIVALAVPSSKPWEIAHPMDFLILCILGGLGGVGQL